MISIFLTALKGAPAAYGAACLIGYLLGCSNMAYYLGRLRHVDLRAGGSRNLGASNVTALIGPAAGILTGLHDILKAAAAVWLVRLLLPALPEIGFVAGTAAVFGHIFPFYLKFHGGKGFASYLGILLAQQPVVFLIFGVVVVLVTLLSDYIVFGTFTVILCYPLFLLLTGAPAAACLVFTASLCILLKHRENIDRLRRGTEIGLRRALKEKKRS